MIWFVFNGWANNIINKFNVRRMEWTIYPKCYLIDYYILLLGRVVAKLAYERIDVFSLWVGKLA